MKPIVSMNSSTGMPFSIWTSLKASSANCGLCVWGVWPLAEVTTSRQRIAAANDANDANGRINRFFKRPFASLALLAAKNILTSFSEYSEDPCCLRQPRLRIIGQRPAIGPEVAIYMVSLEELKELGGSLHEPVVSHSSRGKPE